MAITVLIYALLLTDSTPIALLKEGQYIHKNIPPIKATTFVIFESLQFFESPAFYGDNTFEHANPNRAPNNYIKIFKIYKIRFFCVISHCK